MLPPVICSACESDEISQITVMRAASLTAPGTLLVVFERAGYARGSKDISPDANENN